jgi:hypothetical protein
MKKMIALLVLVSCFVIVCKKSTEPEAANVVMDLGRWETHGHTPNLTRHLYYTLRNIGNKTAYNVRPWIKWGDGTSEYLKTIEALDPDIEVTDQTVRTQNENTDVVDHKVFWD